MILSIMMEVIVVWMMIQKFKGENHMTYRIEYNNSKCCNFANDRTDLVKWLRLLKDETITDICKINKNGNSESVLNKYKKYIKN